MTFILVFIILLPNFTTHDIGWDEPVYVFAGRAYIIALTERNFLVMFGNGIMSTHH